LTESREVTENNVTESRAAEALVKGDDDWQSSLAVSDTETRASSNALLCASLESTSGLSGSASSREQPGIPQHPLQAYHFYVHDLHSTDDLMQGRIAHKFMNLRAKQEELDAKQEECDSLNAYARVLDMLPNAKQDEPDSLKAGTQAPEEPRDRLRRSLSDRQYNLSNKPRSFCQESQDYYVLLSQTDVADGRRGYYTALANKIRFKHSIGEPSSDAKTHDSC